MLWSPFVPFEQVAALAASRIFRLTSAFRPDLQHGRQPRAAATTPARPTTSSTSRFAQYQADASVVAHGDAAREAAGRGLAEAEAAAQCERGDVEEYAALRPGRGGGAARAPPGPPEIADAVAA